METGMFHSDACGLSGTGRNSNLKILILEDNDEDAELIESELRTGEINFSSVRADTKDSFLRGIEKCPPDMIFSGCKLSSFEGLSALEIAREKCPGVPFILVSETTARECEIEALTKGAADYILKERLWRLVPAVNRALCEARERERCRQDSERFNNQLKRMSALRAIDIAIMSSLDLNVTLNVFLDQVMTQLSVDAASVCYHKPKLQMLEYAVGRGFRTEAIRNLRVRLGRGYAGQVALTRKLLALNDVSAEKRPDRPSFIDEEGFNAYFGVPLIAKGHVTGVLEVFKRTPFRPDDEWIDFLESLAGQAAIAIDNANMFTELQRANDKLTMVYESTLEGWSKALDYRDKETEGHSQRVTELSVKVAETMGINDEDLSNVRRGALLHDIGKLGIPDNILFKPGKLTEIEMEIMRQHPTIAYELLSPIPFLSKATDIPYCHHEKWDGTGYPRGLKGEQIPLSARIFAIVDVWDALTSNRPYRLAWAKEKTREHILQQTGTHFDPKVAEAFWQHESDRIRH